MRKLSILTLLVALMPLHLQALDTSELLSLVAMPLAVNAVSEATGVRAADLSQVVAAFNEAAVPPTEFVQVIRYVPVALVVEEERPQFIRFVQTEVANGVTGTRLVRVVDQRLQTYDVTPQFIALTEPAPQFVVTEHYVPASVVARVTELRASPVTAASLETSDLLSLVAMPLAVSAVSNITGIPLNELSAFVATLNSANVAPIQVVEILRYVPVALVDTETDFVQFVRAEVNEGVRSDALVNVIVQQLRTYDLSPQLAERPRPIVVDGQFVPAIVVQRVAEVRSHPHGGPPGQLKKEVGVQTGAEIVHGASRAREPRRNRIATVDRTPDRTERARPPRVDRQARGGPEIKVPPGQMKKNAPDRGPQVAPTGQPPTDAGGKGQGQKPNHGKGKGKGKD